MPEYTELTAVNADNLGKYDKIKTPFAQIIVGGSTEKPCYSIMWWDTTSKECIIGYSSYFFGYVRKWLEEDFEITPAADVVAVVRCGECERRCKSADLTDSVYCPWLKLQMRKNDFCSYGERRGEEC